MSGYARRQGAPPLSRTRSLVVPDGDKLEDLEEANPFSFKEFLKTKNLSLSKEDTATSRIYPKAQLSNFKRENEALRSGQGASLTVVKQNTDVALQNLHVVMNSAHASIKQLVSGAETLNLVAEILKSIDRITEVKDEADS